MCRHGDLRQQAMVFWVARSKRSKRWRVLLQLDPTLRLANLKTERYPFGGPATWTGWRRGCEEPACLSDEVIEQRAVMSLPGPSRQAAFFKPTVANGALRTWLDLQLAPPSRE